MLNQTSPHSLPDAPFVPADSAAIVEDVIRRIEARLPHSDGFATTESGSMHISTDAAAESVSVDIFTEAEVASCGKIRIPQMTVTPSGVLLVAQCRMANMTTPTGGLDDDQHLATVVSKFSTDGGLTWGAMKTLTGVGYSHGQVVYDAVRQRVLMQYQHHPSADPEFNSTLYQLFSTDDGATWSHPTDINARVARCNPKAPNDMQVGTAGAKIQTSSGRIVFVGHGKGTACRWWTDDGGATYHTSSVYHANEAAVAEVAPRHVYMNARGSGFPWAGNRTSFWSDDDGKTFSEPVASPLGDVSCSAGLVAEPPDPEVNLSRPHARLFFSEPAGPGREGLTVHCSSDRGQTWPYSYRVTGASEPAAYSALRFVGGSAAPNPTDGRAAPSTRQRQRLLVVWEEPFDFASSGGSGWTEGSDSRVLPHREAVIDRGARFASAKPRHVRMKARLIDTTWCAA